MVYDGNTVMQVQDLAHLQSIYYWQQEATSARGQLDTAADFLGRKPLYPMFTSILDNANNLPYNFTLSMPINHFFAGLFDEGAQYIDIKQ